MLVRQEKLWPSQHSQQQCRENGRIHGQQTAGTPHPQPSQTINQGRLPQDDSRWLLPVTPLYQVPSQVLREKVPPGNVPSSDPLTTPVQAQVRAGQVIWSKYFQPKLVREGMRQESLWMFIGLTRKIQIPKPKNNCLRDDRARSGSGMCAGHCPGHVFTVHGVYSM